MPKTSKTKTPRPSPVETTTASSSSSVTKVKKPRQSSFINSKNHKLPTLKVSPQELANLTQLTVSNRNRHETSFNCLFTRQNKFGGWEFQLTDGVYESLMDIITSDMDYDLEVEGATCCVSKDDYTGHWRLRAKLSKAYLANQSRDSVPIPEDNSIVNVIGAFETGKVKGNPTCYFQIDGIQQIVAEKSKSGSQVEATEEDDE